jgi:general secretion pathway protein A
MDRHRVIGTLVRNAASEVFGKRIIPNWLPWAAAGSTAVVLLCATVALWNTHLLSSKQQASIGTTATHAHTTPPTQVAGDKLTPVSTTTGASAPPTAAVGTISRETVSLASLLAKHADETDTDSAFANLFGLWGLKYTPASTDPCTQATQQGLDCLTQRGSLAQLHLYNRPAILLVNDDAGNSHQVVLTHLDDEHARIELGGTTHDIGIGELSRYWFGDFVMLWRPGTSQVKSLAPGMHGPDVRWLRESLQHVRGEHSDGQASDVFDTDLASLVRDFQRLHRLTVDGIAGVQTQIALASAVAGSDAPLLYVADTHGG